MAVSKRLRYEVLRRDNHACRYCGSSAPDVKLTVDHVIPSSLGGADEPDNLVAACIDCNAGKAASNPDAPLVADVQQDMLRWRKAIFLAQCESTQQAEARDDIRMAFLDEWTWKTGQTRLLDMVPPTWWHSVDQWVMAGATLADMQVAAERTVVRDQLRRLDDPWRYAAGVMWTLLRERQERALQIVSSGEATVEARDGEN